MQTSSNPMLEEKTAESLPKKFGRLKLISNYNKDTKLPKNHKKDCI